MRPHRIVNAINRAAKMLITSETPATAIAKELFTVSRRGLATRVDSLVEVPTPCGDLSVTHVTVVADKSDSGESILRMADSVIASAADSTVVLADKTRFYHRGALGSWAGLEDKTIVEYLESNGADALEPTTIADRLISRELKTLFVPSHPGHIVVATTDTEGHCVAIVSHRPDRGSPLLGRGLFASPAVTVAYPELFGAQTAGMFKGKNTRLVEELNKIAAVMLVNPSWKIEMTIYPNELLRWRDPAILDRLDRLSREPHPLYNLCSMAISDEEYEAIVAVHPELRASLDGLIEASASNLGTDTLVAPMAARGHSVAASMNCINAAMRVFMGDAHAVDKAVVADPVVQVGAYQIAVFMLNKEKACELLGKTSMVRDELFDLTARRRPGRFS